jgi:hypothetical protein
MDDNNKAKLAFIGGAILFLIESGLQVSGLTNLPLAITLWGLAALLFLYWVGHSANDWRAKRGKPRLKLEPSHLITLGIIIAAAGLVWNQFWFVRDTGPILVTTTIPTANAAPLQPTKPFSLPPIPADSLAQMNRYVQLKHFLTPVKNQREVMVRTGENLFRVLNTPKVRYGSGPGMARTQWNQSMQFIQEASKTCYPDRPIDLLTMPAIDNQFKKVPGEADGLEQADAFEFRKFYYHYTKVIKETDDLINDLRDESDAIERKIANTSAGKIIAQ